MKKGDIVQRRKALPKGSVLIRNAAGKEQAEEYMLTIEKWYNFREIPRMTTAIVDGSLCVVVDEDTYIAVEARVSWVVGEEMSVEYLDTGAFQIIDLKTETDWIVIHESTPQYQDTVEHLSDEDLRNSIEELRGKRLSTPIAQKVRSGKTRSTSAPQETEEDRELKKLLSEKSPEELLELKRKLGLVD